MFRRILATALAVASPIALAGTPAAFASHSTSAVARPHSSGHCGPDTYVNARGNCVQRPRHAQLVPQGASAQCRDGTYSFSQSRRGTCSHHGGVARWLQ
jgi:hypothetical protein